MAYSVDMVAAARRHFEAGNMLAETKRSDVAGYIYGLAAECAIKSMLVQVGLRPASDHKTANDPFFAHFPELRTLLRDKLAGRRSTSLSNLVQSDSFFNNWSTKMRYSDGKSIEKKQVAIWAAQARSALDLMGT